MGAYMADVGGDVYEAALQKRGEGRLYVCCGTLDSHERRYEANAIQVFPDIES